MKLTLQKAVSFLRLLQLAVLLLVLNQPGIALADANKSDHKNTLSAQCDPDDPSCIDLPPIVYISADPATVKVLGTSIITVDATDNEGIQSVFLTSSAGYSKTYTGGGKTSLVINQTFRFSTENKYTFTATVVDTFGQSSSASVVVTATAPQQEPQGSFTLSASPAEGFAGGSASAKVTATSKSGFSGTVTVKVEGSVANFVSLEPCTVTLVANGSAACTARFQIPSSISSSPGTYDFLGAVQGSSGSKSAKTKLRLTLKSMVAVSAGSYHSLALDSEGKVWAWGSNDKGQLGNGDTDASATPIQVPDLSNVVAIAAGEQYSLALDSEGRVWAWGYNHYGQLGDGTALNRNIPALIQNLSDVAAIAPGGDHALALTNDGNIWAWGKNLSGQLGDGTTIDRFTPVQVLSDVVAIAAGVFHSLAIKDDGSAWAWGDNRHGQLGDGTYSERISPVQVKNLSDVAAIKGGGYHSLAVTDDGNVWAWGYNASGQLGNGVEGTTTSGMKTTPVQVQNLSDVAAIAAGIQDSLALMSDGSAWAWGSNGYGQLGDGTTTNRATPIQVQGLSDVAAISAGYYHSLALDSEGKVWAWGKNLHGQLGDGTSTDRSTPAPVLVE